MYIGMTGDKHCPIDIHVFNRKNFPHGKTLTKEDYVIISGDFGTFWNGGREDKWWQNWLHERPWTTLFVPGNHENYDILNAFPETEMFGSMVKACSPSIYMLQTGHVYNIGGNTIFAYGGALSIDRAYRKEDISWWPQEIPSPEQHENAIKNLDAVNWKVDYVVSHTCPVYEVPTFMELSHKAGFTKLDPTEYQLQEIKDRLDFKKWYFGHFHVSKCVGRFQCLYRNIVELGQ